MPARVPDGPGVAARTGAVAFPWLCSPADFLCGDPSMSWFAHPLLLAALCGWCGVAPRSEEHTSELQSRENLVCRLLLEKKNATGEMDKVDYTAGTHR